jgi:hypothetical protein
VKFNYGLDDYVGSTRKDDRYSVRRRSTYKLNRMAQDQGRDPPGMAAARPSRASIYDATVFMLGMKLTPETESRIIFQFIVRSVWQTNPSRLDGIPAVTALI